ncbi:hypothetical protein Tsubulata_002999, partial [Turnera subulata]
MDLQRLAIDYIQFGHRFNKPTPKQLEEDLIGNNVIDHLKDSLSRTLEIFTPLAGRLTITEHQDNKTMSFHLDCNNGDGALFVDAAAPGVSVAQILEASCVPEVRIFHFTKGSIAALKAKANAEIGNSAASNASISSLQVILAHFWRSMTRIKLLEVVADTEEETHCRVIMNVRHRLRPPLPDEYFRNAIIEVPTTTRSGELVEHGLDWATLQNNKTIARQTEEEIKRKLKAWVEKPQAPKIVGGGLVVGGSPGSMSMVMILDGASQSQCELERTEVWTFMLASVLRCYSPWKMIQSSSQLCLQKII